MKRHIILLGLLLTFYNIYSQDTKGFINKTPDFPKIATPNASAFNKYIDNPVSLYTGTPEINIPIYNLKDGQIEIPLSLSYNTSGIKADEEASWVGLGWNLNAGGVITQNVVGGDDFNDTQYQDILTKLNINTSGTSTQDYINVNYTHDLHIALSTYIYSTTNVNQAGKLNPDVFYFSYPGGSGKFIVDYRNDSVYILNRQSNIKIDKQWDALKLRLTGFTITTPEGIKHIFSEKTNLHNISTSENVSKSYTLENSIYPNGQIVRYVYDTFATIKYNRNENLQAVIPGQVMSGSQSGEQSVYSYSDGINSGEEFYLKKITTNNYQVTFVVSKRDDYVNGMKLDSIRIEPINKQSNYQSKLFNLKYDYFVANSNSSGWTPPVLPNWIDASLAWTADYGLKRLKLISFNQVNDTKTNDKYEFVYDETITLPKKNTYETDYWGYYNGKYGADTYMPYLKPLMWATTIESHGMETLSRSYEGWVTPKYRDRGYDYNFCKAGILKGIKYPTGGYTEYNYEPNSFIDYPIPTINQVYVDPNLKTATAQDCNGVADVTTARIRINKPTYAKVTITLNKGMNNWSDIWNTSMADSQKPVAFIGRNTATGFDRIIKTYDGFADQCIYYANHFPNESSIIIKDSFLLDIPVADQTYEYFINVNYGLNPAIINYGDSRSGSMTATIQYSSGDAVIEKVDVQGCGLRIKTINSYNKQGDAIPVLTTDYEYKNPKTEKSSGVLHDILHFAKVYYGATNYAAVGSNPPGISPGSPEYTWPTLTLYPIDLIQICGNNNASNPYGSIGGVGYSYVKETRKASNIFTGYTLHCFENKEPIYTETSVRIDDPKNGKLLKTEVYNQNNLLVKKDSFDYWIKENHRYMGINITNFLNMFPGIFTNSNFRLVPYGSNQPNGDLSNSDGYIDPSLHVAQMGILVHQLNAYDVTLISKTTVLDRISTKEDYSYNTNTLQLKRKDLTLENGNTLSYSYSYPNDYSWAPYSVMADKNRISNVLEEKIFRNNLFVGGTLTEYKSIPVGDGTIYTEVPSVKHFSQVTSRIPDPLTLTSTGVNISIYPKADIVYDAYDRLGNINYVNQNDANKEVYIWGYNYQYPVAKIEGLSYSDIANVLPANFIDNLAARPIPTIDQLNTIRIKLADKNAIVTTYTYDPLVGMTSKTDPRGVTTSYTYDTFNRLYLSRNDDKNIIGRYQYAYQSSSSTDEQGGYSNLSASVSPEAINHIPGDNGTITLSSVSGGSGSYTYDWYLKNNDGTVLSSNLNTSSNSFTFTYSQTGVLKVICLITDDETGQSTTVEKTVNYFTIPTASVTIGAAYYMLNGTGTATVSAGGGSGNYAYAWSLKNSNGTVLQTNTTSSFSYTCSQAGTLTVQCVVTDNTTGQTATDTKTVTCYTLPTAAVTTGASYYMLNGTGSATVSAGEGSGNYAYAWSLKNSNGTVLQTNTTSSFSYTCSQAGTLTVQCIVTDNTTGQTATDSKNVICYTVPTASITIGAAYYMLNATGTATVATGSGSGNFSYSWTLKNSSGTVLQTSTSSSFSYTCSQAGTLTVQCVATDNVTGQTATDSKNVTCYTYPTGTVSIGASYYMLNGAGTATVAAGSGSGNFSYSWTLKNGSGTVLQTSTSSSFSYACSQAGTLTVQCVVTDNVTGQTATDSKNVTCYTYPTGTVSIGASYYMLNGAGTATVATGSGSGNFSYSWTLKNSSGTVLQTSTSNSFSYTCSQAGTLTVQCVVTDNVTGQTATDSKNVTCYTVPTASVTIGAVYYMLNGTGTATVATGSGSGNFSYSWTLKNSSGTVLQTSTSSSFSYTCSQAGTLTVQCVATDNVTGQTATDSKNVTCYTYPTGTVSIGAAYYMLNGTGTATVATGSGSGNFSYSWTLKNSSGTVLQTSSSSSFSYTCSQAGALTVQCIVTDNTTGQTATDSKNVTCYTVPIASVTIGASYYMLNGTGTAAVAAGSGSGNFSYSWSLKNSSGTVLQTSSSSSFSYACSQAGTLTVQCVVTDNVTGQTATNSKTVICYTVPTASVTIGASYYVLNDAGTATVTTGNGSGNFSYSWSLKNSAGTVLQNGTNAAQFNYTCSQGGVVTLQCVVTDNITGQTAIATQTAPCYVAPTVTVTTNVSYYLLNGVGTATATTSGGYGSYTYNWYLINSSGTQLQTGINSPQFNFTCTQSGTLTVKSVVVNQTSGQTVITNQTVPCYTVPTTTVSIGASYYLLNGVGTATTSTAGSGSGNFSYSWSLKNGSGTVLQTSTSSSFSYTCSQAGTLTVQCVVTDNVTGQTATDSKNVTCYTVPTASVAIGAVYYMLNGTGTATVAAGSGSGNFSYSWSLKSSSGTVLQTSTSSSFSYTCSQAGTLTVQCLVTDNVTGQTATDSKNVTCYTVPTASVTTSAVYYILNSTGTATIVTGSGSGNFSYSWSLKNSSGTVLQSSTSSSFSYTCSQTGTLIVQCVIKDNVTGITATASTNITVATTYPCGFTMQPGFNNITSSISCDNSTSTYYIVFSATSTMQLYTTYLVATICSNCCPSSIVTTTYTTSGRTWHLAFYPNGNVYFTIISGPSLPSGSGVGFGTWTFGK